MAKKKSSFWVGIKNLILIICCFWVLSLFYTGFLNVEDVYKLRYPMSHAEHVSKYANLYDIDEDGLDAILNTKYAIKTNHGLIYLCEVNELVNKKIHKLHIRKTENELSAFHVIEV